MSLNDYSFEFPDFLLLGGENKQKMSENEASDPGSDVPGVSHEEKRTMSTHEKENDDIANPLSSSHLDLEVKPPLTTIKRGMINHLCV